MHDNKTYKLLLNKLRMNAAIARFVQVMITAIVLTHLFACFWFLTSKIDDFNPMTWIYRNNFEDKSSGF